MAEEPKEHAGSTPTDGGMAQTVPDLGDMFRDQDTRAMLHEMQSAVGGLVESMRAIGARQDLDSRKFDSLARDNQEMLNRLKEMTPKLDDVQGFIKHGVPSLATKADIVTVQSDLSHRPTRRQSVLDVFLIVGFVGAIIAITTHFAR